MRMPAALEQRTYAGAAPVLFLWGLALALSPIAGLGPGNPQVSHFLLTAVLALVLTTYFMPVRLDATLMLLGGLWVADVMLVNLGNWFASGQRDSKFLLSIFYYSFNFFVMVATAAMALAVPERFARATRLGLLAGLVIETIAALALGGEHRTRGTFENPNQLGYWVLAVAACWLALKRREEHLGLVDGLVLALALLLCSQSGSRAAMLGCLALVIGAVVWFRVHARAVPGFAVAAVALAIVGYATLDIWTARVVEQPGVARFDQNKRHDSFAGRGYDRIWLYPEYLIAGAGEGNFERFRAKSKGGGTEVHSSFATILFGYGIPGTVLFALMLVRIFRGGGVAPLALAAPLAVYGLAHQGLRLTLLWVFFGIVLAKGLETRPSEPEEDRSPPNR